MNGLLSVQSLRVIAAQHRLVGIVRPLSHGAPPSAGRTLQRRVVAAARTLMGRSGGSLDAISRSLAVPIWEARSGDDPEIAGLVRAAKPDLICIAGYPWLLRGEVVTAAAHGAVNLHPALLPRHRGLLPLFWIYYHNDRETGVTLHRAIAEADAGDILGQVSFPLERGFPVDRLNRLNAERGAGLLEAVLRDLAAGRAKGRSQDEALVTHAPRIRPGSPMVDFPTWEVERVWHFLAGLFPRFREPLRAESGAPLQYRGVQGFVREAHRHPPGTVLRGSGGYHLYCRGGRVQLTAGT